MSKQKQVDAITIVGTLVMEVVRVVVMEVAVVVTDVVQLIVKIHVLVAVLGRAPDLVKGLAMALAPILTTYKKMNMANMSAKYNNDLSRRDFLKSAVRRVLPVMGLLVLEQINPIHASSTSCPGYCGSTCVGTCYYTCYNSCTGSCRLECTGTCMGGCNTSCGGWCTVCQV